MEEGDNTRKGSRMGKTKIAELTEFGQSAWLDYISRALIDKGKLKEMIGLGLMGLTSNPTIFDKAISSSNDYDALIIELCKSGKSTFDVYDDLTVRDVQDAADLFRDIYSKTKGLDGYVSLEVNPKLAHKTQETIEEAKRLYKKVDRPNILFKVPSTYHGIKAIEELTASGININATLIFSLEQYIDTAQAYIEGLRRLIQDGKDPKDVHSVTSVFVSRIDTSCDKILDQKITTEKDKQKKAKLLSSKGKAAVANSSLIYGKYLEIFSSPEFEELKDKGANVQRALWGSTSTKDPAYSDIKYVTELIGKGTVNTIPQKTLEAFLDHGEVKEGLTGDITASRKIIEDLKNMEIDVNGVCAKLLNDGVIAFEKSFESLLTSIEEKSKSLSKV